MPQIQDVLMRSFLLPSVHSRKKRRPSHQATLYLHLPVEGVGLLEFKAIDRIESMGYELALEPLRRWAGDRSVGDET